MDFILLTMLLFIKLFWLKKNMARLLQNIYCKCSIYAFVRKLTIPTFSKAMNQDLLGAYGLSYSQGVSPNGGKSPEVGAGGVKSASTPCCRYKTEF